MSIKAPLYKLIFFKLMGWKIEGTIQAATEKCIMIVVPHTSWHDFYLGLFTRGILGLDMHFVGKKELFKFPFGFYFKWMGGVPLDRTPGQNKVDAIAELFQKRNVFRMAIAPEGTRKKVNEWKTGFYYISLQAKVPIIPVAFDFGNKTVKLGNEFWPTGNQTQDFRNLQIFFKDVKGKIPENGFEVMD
jgi:1-acyl-sn-glycerol-3-phosphate acyltransferase